MRRSVNEITGSRRIRRNRRFDWSRRLVRENTISANDLIWPIFLIEGQNERQSISSMPGVERMSIDLAVKAAQDAHALGVPAIATFANIPISKRDETGSAIMDADGIINEATKAIKDAVPEMGIITDVALDPFTSHGQDGLMRDGQILNDETVSIICEAAVIQAEAGADIIAPSEMMDGRIGAIRDALDDTGFEDVAIMSYAAKYASAFYGPYREAVSTKDLLQGDKKTYYVDPANSDEALLECQLDIEEGADMLMIKPGMPYLDIIRRVKDTYQMPTFAYQVSGEYSMIMAGAANGFLDEERAMMESMMAFKRAGCDGVLTYFAPKIAKLLQESSDL
ncbi:MAG: porphobilinogen synthase [Nitratireductor sp.]